MRIGDLAKYIYHYEKNPFARWIRSIQERRLRKVGLRYDDLLDPASDIDVMVALDRLPDEVVIARTQRLIRATDLCMKHIDLPKKMQAMQTPYRSYLLDMRELIRKENAERKSMGAIPLHQRTLF